MIYIYIYITYKRISARLVPLDLLDLQGVCPAHGTGASWGKTSWDPRGNIGKI